jgi:hypothetical protein
LADGISHFPAGVNVQTMQFLRLLFIDAKKKPPSCPGGSKPRFAKETAGHAEA